MDTARLADVLLRDAFGASHRLGDFWSDRSTVLVFLRHFG